jgi:hypothetical protein
MTGDPRKPKGHEFWALKACFRPFAVFPNQPATAGERQKAAVGAAGVMREERRVLLGPVPSYEAVGLFL